MKVPNISLPPGSNNLSLSRLQNEGSQLLNALQSAANKSIKATE
ncbi:hypothetical protein HMPREF0742_02691 [Rothia aeria F0184]|uniref:Uncharacterized protein n=1 Tax=Rothia aeria F0184 TaxID=888019 RepID=U7UXH1_9MICC|nr:hypothetical protein HMPREF0742_02691 [Rothia aeria F0184]